MIAALTWAAAQDRIPVHELIRGLTPTDGRRIEAAYAEWRRRAAAGERRHKVDWHTYPVQDIPPEEAPTAAKDVVTVAIPVARTEDDEQDDEQADPDVADAMEQILAVEAEEPEYISLADFNLEPSEVEMRKMDALIRKEEAETASTEVVPTSVAEAEGNHTAEKAEAEPAPIEQRISKLGKDASPAAYAELLTAFVGDVEKAKAVTEAVIKDHTRRHRGTASQKALLVWLEKMSIEGRK